MPKGELELEHRSLLQPGSSTGETDHWQHREELESGIAPRWQLAGYLNWSHDHATRFDSVSLEIIHQLRDPEDGRLGLAFYVEPEAGPREQALEWRLMLQKNARNERWIAAANLSGEHAREREYDGAIERESTLELSAGLSYRLAPALRFGIEGRHEREFEGLVYRRNSASATHLGPSLQYEGHGWATALAWRKRLAGGDAAAANEYLLKLSVELGDEN